MCKNYGNRANFICIMKCVYTIIFSLEIKWAVDKSHMRLLRCPGDVLFVLLLIICIIYNMLNVHRYFVRLQTFS